METADESLTYLVGYLLSDRKRIILEKAQHPLRKFPVKFRKKMIDAPVVSVPLNLPVYRIENNRTRTLQEEYLTTKGMSDENFFKMDLDSVRVQSAQDSILRNLIEDKDLLELFQKPGTEQDQPLLCTMDGIVVNGNRRLCTWRKLLKDDPVAYSYFKSVDIALLPQDCDNEDIDEIERELQIKKDVKASYSWHARASLMLHYKDVKRLSLGQIADMFDLKSSNEVATTLDAFAYAREYLKLIGHQNEWTMINDDEYAFKRIVTERNKIGDAATRGIFEACAVAVIRDKSGRISGRNYQVIPEIAKNIDQIEDVLGKDLLVTQDVQSDIDEDPFDFVESDATLSHRYNIEATCRKPENISKVTTIIESVLQDSHTRERDRKSSERLFEDLKDISTKLLAVKNSDLDDRQEKLGEARKQLESIVDTCKQIEKWMSRHDC